MNLSKLIPFIAYVFSISILELSAQATYQNLYGQFGIDFGYDVIQTSDGKIVITGEYDVLADAQVYLVKLDSTGLMDWSMSYGRAKDGKMMNGSGNRGYGVIETADKGFIIGGEVHAFGAGQADMYLIKTDSTGQHLWSRTIGGLIDDYCYSIVPTFDNGFLMAGSTESYGPSFRSVYLAKVSNFGDTMWTRAFGDTSIEAANAIVQTDDSAFAITGYTFSTVSGSADVLLLKLDSDGNILWQYAYGGINNEFGNELINTSDGGFLLCGSVVNDSTFDNDLLLIKTSSKGELEWSRSYGGFDSDVGRSVIELSDGSFVFSGETHSFGNGFLDAYVGRIDSNGDLLWSHAYGGVSDDIAYDLMQTVNGFVLIGSSRSFGIPNIDLYVITLDSVGFNPCNHTATATELRSDTISFDTVTLHGKAGGLYDTSNTVFGPTNSVFKDACDPSALEEVNNLRDVAIFPNPAQSVLLISLKEFDENSIITAEVFDSRGIIYINSFLTHSNMELDVSHLPSAFYYLKVTYNDDSKLIPFVKFK